MKEILYLGTFIYMLKKNIIVHNFQNNFSFNNTFDMKSSIDMLSSVSTYLKIKKVSEGVTNVSTDLTLVTFSQMMKVRIFL